MGGTWCRARILGIWNRSNLLIRLKKQSSNSSNCTPPGLLWWPAMPTLIMLRPAMPGRREVPKVHIQHHYAHVLSCMADNQLRSPVLGIAWDGIGYGADGSLWGGEFLHINEEGFRRVGSLRPFSLPGSSQAIREPRRSALGLLYEVFGETACDHTEWAPVRAFSSQERKVLKKMLRQRINSPMTSSMGRLFDAVASFLDIRQTISYEGTGCDGTGIGCIGIRTFPIFA